MKSFGILVFMFVGGFSVFAEDSDTKVWTFNKSEVLQIVDVANQSGEETMTLIDGKRTRNVKVADVTNDSYSGDFLIRDKSGKVIEDLNVGASFAASYGQILEMLKDESFRSTFTTADEKCAAEDNGYLIITDNLTSQMRGYCLSPKTP